MAKEGVLLQRQLDAERAAHLAERHKLQRDIEALKLLNQEYLKQIAAKDAELAKWHRGQFAPPDATPTDEDIALPARTKARN